MQTILKYLSAISLLILIHTNLYAATYYVKTGGNDSAAGTSDGTAWAHSPEMADWTGSVTLSSGDTVYFRSQDSWTDTINANVLDMQTAGVIYDGSTYGSGTKAKLYGSNAGSAQHYGVLDIGASNTTFQGFEVDANEQDVYGVNVGHGASSNISNITLDDVDVHSVNPSSWGYGIIVSGWDATGIIVSDVTIQNSSIHDNDNEGIALYDSWTQPNSSATGIVIDNCTIYNNLQGIIIANNHDNVVIQDSNIYDNETGIWQRTSPEASSGTPDNAIIRRNKIHGNSLYGYTTQTGVDHGMSVTIYNNFFYDNARYDVLISHGDYETGDFKIYNNTMYSTSAYTGTNLAICPWSNIVTHYPTIDVQNNIMYATNGVPLYNHWVGTTFTFDKNLIYRSSGSGDNHVIDPIGTGYNRTGVLTWDTDAQNTDPFFVNVLTDNYNVIPGSSAINSGADLSGIFIDDFYKTVRPQESIYDIGAYESLFQTEAPVGASYNLYQPTNLYGNI